MAIDAAQWKTVSTMFDQLVELDQDERQRRIDDLALEAPARTLLLDLLTAHDSQDNHPLDQTLSVIASGLLDDESIDFAESDADFTGQRLGNWRVGEAIGHGAMATVFQGQRADGAYEQQVAIKLLRPGRDQSANKDRLCEELRLLARLEHPGIARLIDGGVSDSGWPYLIMEYVDGVHIDQWCTEQGLDWRARLALMVAVCDAVRYAHSKLVVHADIKPSNVLINRQGQPKLVDFGIADLLRDETDTHKDGRPAVLRCSPAYAAPEQLRGEAITTATDVFGIGALLYELLIGERIRSGQTMTKLLLDPSTPQPVPAPSESATSLTPTSRLRGDLDAICAKALAADPKARYPAIEPLRQDLLNHLSHFPVSARSARRTYLVARWLRRHRLGAGVASLVLLSLLIGLSVSIRQTQLATESAQRAEATTAFLLSVFDADEPSDFESPLQATRRDLAERAAEQLDLSYDQQDEAYLPLSTAIARVLRKVGLTDQARPLLMQAIDAAEGLGPTDAQANLVEAWFELGQIESLEERMAPAVSALQRADELARDLSDSPVERAAILFQLGRALSASRQHDAGLAALDEAARLAEASDSTRPLLPRIELLAALTLNRAGRTDEALQAGERAVAGAKAIFGPDHDRTSSALSTVGGMYRLTGHFDRAEAMVREAYDIGIRSYGQPQPAAANNLANTLFTRGHLVEAESFQTEAVGLAEAYYGADSAAAARYRRNLGLIQIWQDDWATGLSNLEQAVAVHSNDTAADDPYTLFLEAQLAWAQLHAGQVDSALAALTRLLRHLPSMTESYPRGSIWVHMLGAELALQSSDPTAGLHGEAMMNLLQDPGPTVSNWESVYFHRVADQVQQAAEQEPARQADGQDTLALAQRLLGAGHPLRQRVERETAATQPED
jgi:serine/threonine protein kinase